ncbi:hypothetical protein BGZ68_003984 [Mortierella alpina]|nr:hypothetical protein BGZ68_003984 [Mortierella alpina]
MQRYDPRVHRIDLTQAPLFRFVVTQDTDGRWLLVQLMHHLIGVHSTADVMELAIQTFLAGRSDKLSAPQPFRHLIAQARFGVSVEAHKKFFIKMLADIDSPSLPYGITEVHRDGVEVAESHRMMPQELNDRLRAHAKRIGVSLASLCHLAWAQVISHTSGQQRVVFGTVLFGRMQGGSGADRTMGLFINTLPLRVDLEDSSVEDSVRKVQADLATLLEHEHASLALAQRCSSVPSGTPLFGALLNYRHNNTPFKQSTDDSGMEVLDAQERTNYPFVMSVEDFGSALGLTAQIVQPIAADRICGYMQQPLQSLVEALDHSPATPVFRLNVIPDEEVHMLLKDWNQTRLDYPEDCCLHQLVEQQTERTPDAIALILEEKELIYRDINSRANRLAHHLIELGVKPDARVAICVDRSMAMIIGVLALLKAGGAYVPLDPAYPSDRLEYILKDAAPSIPLADGKGRGALIEVDLSSLTILDPNTHLTSMPDGNPVIAGLAPNHLAYVIYTSGSTGKPKGVMLEHRGVVNLVDSRPTDFGVTPSSRILQYTTLSFDLSVSEIFMALCSGASLVLMHDHIRRDRRQLWDFLVDKRITHITITPSLLQDGRSTRAGHTTDSDHRWRGPTGDITQNPADTATAFKCTLDTEGETVTIGRPLANKRIYILDAFGQPAPLGVLGEFYIGGVGRARGYMNRAVLTAKAFVADPFSDEKDARMYRTGDLARYLPDGKVMFLGRNDHQVKIRGFRIELGEIEARLLEHPLVSEPIVLACGEGSDKRLVAYVVAEPREDLVDILRTYVSSALPDYMTPAAFVRLDAPPLTPNGKVNRHALPEPDSEAFVTQSFEEPEGEIECVLSAVWREILKISKIGRHDNFFMLGGHSLLAVRLISIIRSTLALEMALRDIFETPTIAGLSKRLVEKTGAPEETSGVLLPLKSTGIRPPLFCVHPVFGLSLSFIGLAKHLHEEQPLYGLQARGLDGRGDLAETVETMAQDYIAQIHMVQAHGPYHLLGWSFGGSVAHSMAVQLENQGEKVALLALMDTTANYTMLSNNFTKDKDGTKYFEHLARSLETNGAEGDENKGMGRGLWEKVQHVVRNNIGLARQYTPLAYGGDVLFFSAIAQMDESMVLVDPQGWVPHVQGTVEVHSVDCAQLEMDRPEPMAKIGQVLAMKLEAMQQQELRN